MGTRRLRTKREVSAGGVIVRPRRRRVEVCLIVRRTDEGSVWGLPKGHVESGEDPQATAIREVREETGLVGIPLVKLGAITYWFTPPLSPSDSNAARRKSSRKRIAAFHRRDVGKGAGFTVQEKRARHFKTVHFYLLRYLDGKTTSHDAEVEDAVWLSIDDAIANASFENERQVLRKAKQAISDIIFRKDI